MNRISADYLFTSQGLRQNHVLEVSDEGKILALRPREKAETSTHFFGILCPGFVNAHCHLELSFLHGKIPEGIGMTGFASSLMAKRQEVAEQEQTAAIPKALQKAFDTGTVVIGDICNGPLSANAKRNFPQIHTHSFIELVGLIGKKAKEIVENGIDLQKQFSSLCSSLTLHAPYSVSQELRDWMYGKTEGKLSIHLMESVSETQLFADGSGSFPVFFQKLGLPPMSFPLDDPAGYILHNLPTDRSVLLVHNTEMSAEKLSQVAHQYPNAWFCLCPRSNLYIHHTFPDIPRFLPYSSRICLGTDSLASNHSLEMLEELKAIQERYTHLPLSTLLGWATINGANALHCNDRFGSFIPGTQPGVNLIEGIVDGPKLRPESRVRKLF